MRGGGLYSAEECLRKAQECRELASDLLQLAEEKKETWPLEARLRRVKWAAESEAKANEWERKARERAA